MNNKWYKFSDTLVEPLGKSDSITHLVGTEKDPMMPNGGKAVNGNAGNGNKKGGSKSSKVENGAGSKQVWTMEKRPFYYVYIFAKLMDLGHSLDFEHRTPATELGRYIKCYLDLGRLFSGPFVQN